MANGGGILRSLLGALLDALSSGKGGSKSRPVNSSSTVATWKNAPTSPRVQSSANPEFSPGREGDGATRDCTLAEIRSMQPSFTPQLDGNPDPGEVIWTWVPYVENDGRGKDRPVLIIARIDRESLAGCYLSTKQHRDFVSVGSGPWDSQGRESFLSPERVLRITEHGMRRESTGVDRDAYDRAVSAVLRYHGIA